MKVAVTGASGFIGRYVVAELLDAGHEVVALGRDAGSLGALGDRVETRVTDYTEESLVAALAGVGAVAHLAARRSERTDDPLRLWTFAEANLKTLETVFFAARAAGATDFVFLSSIAVYSSRNTAPFHESEPAAPINAYGVSKRFCEQLLEFWSAKSGIRTTSLRAAATYGFGERNSAVLMRFLNEAIVGRQLTIRGNGRISIDQIYVRDVATAVAASLKQTNPGGIFNIGSGTTYSLVEMAEAVQTVFPETGAILREDVEDPDVRRDYMRIDAAAEALGWAPAWSLERGLADFRALASRA